MMTKYASLRSFAIPLLVSLSLHGIVLCGIRSFFSVYKAPENGLVQGTVSCIERGEVKLVVIDAVPGKNDTHAEALSKSFSKEVAQQKSVTSDAVPSSSKKQVKQQSGPTQESQASSGHLGSREAMPSYLHNPQPSYPRSEQQSGHEGVVLLHVFVSETGKVMKVVLDKSSGYPLLDSRAKETVESSWSFGPARLNQKTVVSEILIPIHFSLKKNF